MIQHMAECRRAKLSRLNLNRTTTSLYPSRLLGPPVPLLPDSSPTAPRPCHNVTGLLRDEIKARVYGSLCATPSVSVFVCRVHCCVLVSLYLASSYSMLGVSIKQSLPKDCRWHNGPDLHSPAGKISRRFEYPIWPVVRRFARFEMPR